MADSLIVNEPGIRLDRFLSTRYPEYSRTYLQKLISEELVTVNGKTVKSGFKLNINDTVIVSIPALPPSPLAPEAIPVTIVYEDDDLLVVDKPAGLTTHPSPGQTEHTLVNAVLSYYPRLAEMGDSLRPGIVHRLDKDTSGLIIIAKTNQAQLKLIEQFRVRSVSKTYLTLVKGHLTPEKGIIEAPIGRSPSDRKKMAVVNDGKPACSEYKVVKYYKGYTLLEVKPETGRTHQIRVHLSAIGYPMAGDGVYGVKVPFLKRQFLHAHRLSFNLPFSGERVEFKSELPDDLEKALEGLES
ncbi:MAG: RluA family pseudouridine synthase [Dehalococcoidales bacterium]|nr:RluA family pseudouridine synthase [Dehalococcoidales bacterium]